MTAEKHNVNKQLHELLVPIDSLVSDPVNARQHSKRNLEAIAGSYMKHGQRKPVVVQLPSRIVRAGNGQLEAAKGLGWTHIAAVFVEESDEDAKAFAIRDNRTGELASWDVENLGLVLTDLKDAMDLTDLGFTEYEFEPFLVSGEEWEPPPLDATIDDDVVRTEKKEKVEFTAEEYEQLCEMLPPPVTGLMIVNAVRRGYPKS